MSPRALSRRAVLAAGAAAAVSSLSAPLRGEEKKPPALIAITLDLEMSRNFPRWEDTHWDYEKGNLDEPTKRYTVEACRRVRARGGAIHCFAVGRVFEQENVAWLEDIVRAGHPLGNHSYDHVNVAASKIEDVQFRFRRAPWLARGKAPEELIRENITMCAEAMKARLGIAPRGFRTPGGFNDGLRAHPKVQAMLKGQGYAWVSSLYPAHPVGEPGAPLDGKVIETIVRAQSLAQPFAYPGGFIEVPMSPPSDITAFRGGRWRLEDFLAALRCALEWCIERGAAFDFLGHPSCLHVVDPEFKAIDLICDLAAAAGERARLADLDAIAARAREG